MSDLHSEPDVFPRRSARALMFLTLFSLRLLADNQVPKEFTYVNCEFNKRCEQFAIVTLERETRFELATFCLGSMP